MLNKRAILFLFAWFFITATIGIAQEPETNADTSNEANTDAFQEQFYESLKQKGIENYDKAITALLECKQLEPDNDVVAYELGINYMYQNNFIDAQHYLEEAINKNPNNRWYLDALLRCFRQQQNTKEALQIAQKLIQHDNEYYKTLAELYIEAQQLQKALEVLNKMEDEGIDVSVANQLKARLIMLENANAYTEENNGSEKKSVLNNPINDYKNQIQKQLQRTDYNEMLSVSSEAIDNYPTQPEFYYFKGMAFNKLQNYDMATEILEEGLGYLLDDIQLENNFYKELIVAYKGLGNNDKVNEYQKKIKN